MTQAEQLTRRARAAKASLSCVGLTAAFAISTALGYSKYLASLEPNAVVAEVERHCSEILYELAVVANLLAEIATAIFFIRWFHLAHTISSRLTDTSTTYKSHWTFWGFVVPFLNFFRPQQLMREIWEITRRRWQEEPQTEGLHRPRDYVNLWWGTFLAARILSGFINRLSSGATSAAHLLWTTKAGLLANAFEIFAVLVAVALVRNVTEFQKPFLYDVEVATPSRCWRVIWWISGAGAVAIMGIGGLLIYVASVGPATSIYPGDQIPPAYLRTIESVVALDDDEKILYFYSDALTDIRDGFYFVSDKRVVIYSDYRDETPLKKIPLADIVEVELLQSESSLEDNMILLHLRDDSTVWFPVSSKYERDKLFFEAIGERKGVAEND